MSYQVLARKWRPKSFEDMVGQAHVVRALRNALDQDRLHHAYLFSGTRGVGKTTLARILSKALNCEEGISSRPCGRCSACREIDEGRFVDLLEVDAASRTKVDQTRDLLDNVPFAPVKGRFKVYLIDEVHMFSASSFNALLKTLEEPPPHVKFLLATTDPQKVPVTVLSRCLQFNLKRLAPDEIGHQLGHILDAEGVEHQDQALALLARAADGSMRDGLSLLDQAIAYGGGRVIVEDVRSMLGTVSGDLGLNLVRALADMDGNALLGEVARIHQLTPDLGVVLQDLLGLLHRIALCQQLPTTLADDDPERDQLASLAQSMAPEDVQLFYQIALLGQQDLALAPDPRTGLEMVLLRMLAFRPAGSKVDAPPAVRGAAGTAARRDAPASPPSACAPADVQSGVQYARPPTPELRCAEQSGPVTSAAIHPAAAALAAARLATGLDSPAGRPAAPGSRGGAGRRPAVQVTAVARDQGRGTPPIDAMGQPPTAAPPQGRRPAAVASPPTLRSGEDWHRLVAGLGLGGVASELARNCQLGSWDGQRLVLTLDPVSERLRVDSAEGRLREALAGELGGGLDVEFQVSRPEDETPAQRRARRRAERQAEAEALMDADPAVRVLRDELGARVLPGTIIPTQNTPPNGGEHA